MTVESATPVESAWLSAEDVRLADLLDVVAERTDPHDYPHSSGIEQQVVVYDAQQVRAEVATTGGRREVTSEIVRAIDDGPGIVVFTGAFTPEVIDAATAAFNDLIAEQRAAGTAAGDHFAKPGANDRLWNALEKLAVRHPETFVDYYANDIVALVSAAWLGPGYQMTSQINVVNPGGAGQTVHRDYHLGFQSDDVAAAFPAHVHRLSPVLTLQGAIAHVDMPIESGPTLYLPHSQKYLPGYLAWRRPEFADHFASHHIQLPLTKGDAVFFNPALFHAAGSNVSSDIKRMANLLQVSSAFGRAMETIDRARVSEAIYPALLAARRAGLDADSIANVIASSAEGYSFPTNLDLDQPVDGLAPQTQAEIVAAALDEEASAGALHERLTRRADATESH